MTDNKTISISDSGIASDKRMTWWVKVHESDTYDDILSATALWPFCKRHGVKPGDKIEVVHPLRDFFAELLVNKVDESTQSVQSIVIHHFERGEADESKAVDLSSAIVEGPIGDDIYRVRQGRNVLSRGHETEVEAMEWLDLALGRSEKQGAKQTVKKKPAGKKAAA